MFIVSCQQIGRRNAFSLKFPFNEGLIEKIKNLPKENRTWNPNDKLWELTTLGLLTLVRLYRGSNKIHFDFGDEKLRVKALEMMKKADANEKDKLLQLKELEKKKLHWLEYKQHLEDNYEQYSEIVHKNLKEGIICYKHQIVGTMFLNEVNSALLALDMGTGKSLISICLVELNKFKKVFVITPNSLKFNYFEEVFKFTQQSKAHIIGWNKNKYSIEESKYIIVNYDYFNGSDKEKRENKRRGFSTRIVDKFNKLNIGKIDCLICDESHRIANYNQTFINYKKIFNDDIFRDNKVRKIFMSGSPAKSKITNLYTVLHEISPLEFVTKQHFDEYYCGMKWVADEGWVYSEDDAKYEELFHAISPYMYRKKKKDVLKDLPDVIIQKVTLEMTPSEYKIYEELERGVANEFINEDVFNPGTRLLRLKQYTSHLKTKYISDLIDSIIESGDKFVVVDFFKETLKELYEKYKGISVFHTGDIKETEVRAQMIKDFQNNENIKLFFGSQQTVNEGLTLTAANKIGLLTIPYDDDEIAQIYSRLQRIGQKNTVNCYLFVYSNSIDEYILDITERKKKINSLVLDGEKYVSNIGNMVMNDVIEFIKYKYK